MFHIKISPLLKSFNKANSYTRIISDHDNHSCANNRGLCGETCLNTSTWQALVYVNHTDAANPKGGHKICMRIYMSQFNIILMNVKLPLNKYCSYLFFTLDLGIHKIFAEHFGLQYLFGFLYLHLSLQDSQIFFWKPNLITIKFIL